MQTGAITQYIDVAQVVLYAFWVFFAGLIFYIRQEDRREGYPLENDKTGEFGPKSFLFIPDAKTFKLPHGGGTVQVPNDKRDSRPIKAQRVGAWPGAASDPTGNPMVDGVGPASYAERADHPDLTMHGTPKIVPMASAHGYMVDKEDPDPRGMKVFGLDRKVAGTVSEIWVDQSEHTIRYYEVALGAEGGGRKVLLPINFCVVRTKPAQV